jgi:hypothetical protein
MEVLETPILAMWQGKHLPMLKKTAAICGVPTMLVSNLDVIWRTLASSQPINPEKFGELCEKTLEQDMSCAQWYDVPPSLHRVLVHGKEIVEATPLPIGITSEEGVESNTKFARRFHENHTRRRLKKIQCRIYPTE